MRTIKPGDICEIHNCGRIATHTAYGVFYKDGVEQTSVGIFCFDHADEVGYNDDPEYVVTCPNCGCIRGVN